MSRALYTEKEDKMVRKLLSEGKTPTEIGELLHGKVHPSRTIESIRQRASRTLRGISSPPRADIGEFDPKVNPPDRALFEFLRAGPRSIEAISNKFNVTPAVVRRRLQEMDDIGYSLVTSADRQDVGITSARPRVDSPAITLADEEGMVVSVGIASDRHAGSSHSQPSAVKAFVDIASHEYGVRHFIDPGDVTCGVGVYRGQEEDQVPVARAFNTKQAGVAVQAQVDLADIYTPKGYQWYQLGGNHDWASVVKTGLDPVAMLCKQRPDIHYLGYDVNRLWITDKIYIRLWHPSGGVPYAKSYRLQKGIESQAIEAMKAAIRDEDTSVTSVLIAGHLHISLWMPELPIAGLHPGCFEGKNNYLKRKGLEPSIGGTILRFLVTDSGRVQRIEHTWIAFDEVEDDWKNFPLPDGRENAYQSEPLNALYSFEPRDESRFPIEDPRRGLGPGGSEYVGGR